jgi:hypothetical protein
MLTFPSAAGGDVTREVGYLEASAADVAPWLGDGLGEGWTIRGAGWEGLRDAVEALAPRPVMTRYAVVPMQGWSLVLNNGPRGTDVGMLPSQAARELGGRGIRAVCVKDEEPGFPARILEIYSPDGTGPLKSLRSIVAANDGGDWVFETAGDPLPFERLDEYKRRRKTDRFTSELLHHYLRELGTPVDVEPDWGGAFVVEQSDQ